MMKLMLRLEVVWISVVLSYCRTVVAAELLGEMCSGSDSVIVWMSVLVEGGIW